MKTNVSIDLNPEQLDYLATMIDGKVTKRQATRKDITNLVEQFIGGITCEAEYRGGKVTEYNTVQARAETTGANASDLYIIDPEDAVFLKGKDPSYVRGWNQVKRSRSKT